MTANDDTAAGGRWWPTAYGFTNGTIEYHDMVKVGIGPTGLCRHLNALEAKLAAVKRERDSYKQDADTLDKLYHERWDQLAAVKRKLAEATAALEDQNRRWQTVANVVDAEALSGEELFTKLGDLVHNALIANRAALARLNPPRDGQPDVGAGTP